MLFEYLVFLLFGVLSGVICGLMPGLHVNNIGLLVFSVFWSLSLDPMCFAIFLISMATVQSFIDFIPATFLGLPDEETVVSLLPAHRLLVQGRGMEVIHVTGAASLLGVALAIMLLPLAIVLVPMAYGAIEGAILSILAGAVVFLIIREHSTQKRLWASFIFLSSGYLGHICLEILPLSSSDVLLAMFSGLFGLSALLIGLLSKSARIPKQIKCSQRPIRTYIKGSAKGTLGGALVGVLPAISPSQLAIMFLGFGRIFKKGGECENDDSLGFLSIISSLNTSDALFSIFCLYLIGNPRSGVSVLIQDLFGNIGADALIALCAVMFVSGVLAYFIHLRLGIIIAHRANYIDFRKFSLVGIILIVFMVWHICGPLGLGVGIAAASIGIIPQITGVSRTHCMGSLIVPAILFFGF